MTNLSRNHFFAIAAVSLSALVAVPATASAGVICSQVSADKDDAEERLSDGNMYINSDDLDLKPSRASGMRFRNLSIPQGATITYAYISMVARSSDSRYTWLRIFGEDHNDAKNFDNDDHEITSRPLTSASADWVPQS